MECGATVHTGGLPGARRRRIASILAGLAAGLLCGLVQAQEVKTLRWTPPTERTDGTALSADQLAAHRVLCEPGVDVSVPMPATSWAGVEPGIESCVVRAVDQDGLESADSARVFPAWDSDPDPEPDPPGAPTDVRVVAVELPPGDDDVSITLWTNFNHGPLSSGNYTHGATEFPSGVTYTGNHLQLETPGGAWGSQNVLFTGQHWSSYAGISPPASMAALFPSSGRMLLVLELVEPDTRDIFFLAATNNSNGRIRLYVSGGNLTAQFQSNGWGNEAIFNLGAAPTGPSVIELWWDTTQTLAADAFRARTWALGGTPPAFPSPTSAYGNVGTVDPFTSAVFGDGNDFSRYRFGKVIASDDPAEDLSVYAETEDYPAGGSTVEAGLETGAPVLAASVGVERTVSAALSVPAATLAGASDIERQASADLNLAALQLNADAGIIREASAALGIAPLELAASGSVERNASVALVVPQPTLAASAGAGRQVSAALEITAPALLSDVMIERTASGALDVPAAVLAADLGADKTVAAALITPSLTLASQVSVVRLASGELALAVPVLASTVLGEELSVTASLQTPAPVLDASSMVSSTASGALQIAMPVLDGDASREASVEAALIVRAPELAAQAAISRLASGELTIPELEILAQAFQGAIQPVIGLRATVRVIGRTAGVTVIGKKATLQ